MLGRGCPMTRVLKLIIFQYICLYTFTFTPLGVIMPRRKGTNSYIYIYIYIDIHAHNHVYVETQMSRESNTGLLQAL